MILRAKPVLIDAIQFQDLDAGYREQWVHEAIASGMIYMQGGADPYWTVETPSGKVQMRLGDWLVRFPAGSLHVLKSDELWARFEYHDPGQR